MTCYTSALLENSSSAAYWAALTNLKDQVDHFERPPVLQVVKKLVITL